MKTLKIAFIVTFLVVAFLSVNVVSALTSSEASATSYWSIASPAPGQQVTVTVNFQSSSTESLSIYRMGFHADWMDSGYFVTLDYESDPEVVESGGLFVAKFTILIPATTTVGSHSYYIAADGFDGSGDSFQWDSSQSNIEISAVAASTPTPTPTSSGGQTGDSSLDMLLGVAIIAVTALIVLAIIIFVVIRKKRAHPKPSGESVGDQPAPPKPDQKPESGQDFTV